MSLDHKYNDEFSRIWYVYPRKDGKALAERKFLSMKFTEHDVDELVKHIDKRKRGDPKWLPNKKGDTFIPHLSTFLNGRRWEDVWEPTTYHQRYYDVPDKPETPIDRAKADRARAEAIAMLRDMGLTRH